MRSFWEIRLLCLGPDPTFLTKLHLSFRPHWGILYLAQQGADRVLTALRKGGIFLSTSPLTLTMPWGNWKEQTQRGSVTCPGLHSCFGQFCSRKSTGWGRHKGSAAESACVGVALSGDWARFVLAFVSRNPATPGVCPHSGAGRAGPGHWHWWGQLE